MQPCGANLGEIARHDTAGNLYVPVEHWQETCDGLEQCGFSRAVRTNDAHAFAATKSEAAGTSDLNLRRLAVSD
jgi:hypothetical protein